MHSARKNAVDLWRERKGLLILLIAGTMVVLLAAVAPQAWATPEQNPLQQSINIPCIGPLVGAVFEDVDQSGDYTVGDIGIAGVMVILDPGPGEQVTYTDDGTLYGQGPGIFVFDPVAEGMHTIRIQVPSGYVVTVANPQMVNVPNWQPGDPACAKAFFPLEPVMVGGHVMPPSRLTLLIPLLGMFAVVGAIATSVIVWRRRLT